MTTCATIISDALRSLSVIEEDETPSDSMYDIGLRRLNQMLESWAVDGIDIGYFTQDSEDNTIPVPLWAEQAITDKLAVKLSDDFQAPLQSTLIMAANEGYNFIIRTVLNNKSITSDMSHLPQGSSGRWNIEDDTL